MVSANGVCLDELEVYGQLDSDGDGVTDTADICPGFDDNADADGDGTPDGCDPIEITAEPGFDIAEVGHRNLDYGEGAFFNSPVPDNVASVSAGSLHFGSSELGLGLHLIQHINDGLYGNSRSWIPDPSDADPFVGVEFAGLNSIGSIAWGRDNNDNNDPSGIDDSCDECTTSRWEGTYFIEVTTDAGAAQDPSAVSWATVGSVVYSTPTGGRLMWRRHRFNLAQSGQPIMARALRLRVSTTEFDQCIDELEIHGTCIGDSDFDGVCDDLDLCPGFDDSVDGDGDDVPDACDVCFGDDASGDTDADTVCDDRDVCPGLDDRTQCAHPANILCVRAGAAGAGDGTNWFNAYNDLGTALAAASAGQEVWVAAGTYMPDGGTLSVAGVVTLGSANRFESFALKTGVGIYGGFYGIETQRDQRDPAANMTVLSGDLNANDGPNFANNVENSYHVTTGSGTDATAVLDGFTVKSGNANGLFPDFGGGGMFNDTGSPTVTNCTFGGNTALIGGGMYNINSSPTVTNCILWGNTANSRPQILISSSTPIIGSCDIQGSGGSGAGWDTQLGTDAGGNIDVDPLFGDADGADDIPGTEDDDLSIPSGSPCVDAGDNSAPGLVGLLVDIMGYARFFDDPATPDTGVGPPPTVDIGAHEYQFPIPLGDMNCDGAVDFDDVAPFVQALLDPAAYAASFPTCSIDNADMNEDTFENGDDLQIFVDTLMVP